jgi:hypothetical protein
MKRIENTTEFTHLMCREIQAPIVSALIKGFVEKFGTEETHALAKEIICKDAAMAGKALVKEYLGNSLDELLKIVEEVWAEGGTMEIENVNMDDNCLRFDVVRCGYAEMYERLGVKELGGLLSCCRDFAFIDGFNPELQLVRTKTIMEGDDICNFCYKPK